MTKAESKVSVSVEDMAAWIDIVRNETDLKLREHNLHPAVVEALTNRSRKLAVIRDYILTAHAAIAERDAEIADLRQTSGDLCSVCSWRGVRGYGCEFCALVEAKREIADAIAVLGPSMPESGLVDACHQVKQAAISEADNARKLESQVAHLERKFPCGHRFYDWASPEESCVACAAKEFYERACDGYDAQIAEMRLITGPKCPKCEHWLKAEHAFTASVSPSYTPGYLRYDSDSPCRITVADLLGNYPEIAAEMNLTPKESPNV